MKKITLLFILLTLGSICGFSQTAKKSPAKTDAEVSGSISGTVLDENNTPIEDAEVSLSSLNSKIASGNSTTVTNRKGEFVFDKIKNTKYKIIVRYAGYVLPEIKLPDGTFKDTYQIGDNPQISLQKGGVITGKVTDYEGNPLIRVPVQVLRVRDEFGNKILAESGNPTFLINYASPQHLTDDRGIYRIFGINAGSYLVFVGGQKRMQIKSLTSSDYAPIYYPSDTVDTATEVEVGFGQVTDFVNITFRQMNGYTISGEIIPPKTSDKQPPRFALNLIHGSTAIPIVGDENIRQIQGKYAFKLEQIPVGEYELQALLWGNNGQTHRSSPLKIEIKDNDVTGLVINLKPLVSIAGKIILERNPSLQKNKQCRQPLVNALTTSVFKVLPIEFNSTILKQNVGYANRYYITPDEKGSFETDGLESGNYFLSGGISDKSLYVKEFYQEVSPKKKRDLSEVGLNLQSVEKLQNIKIVLSDGAAKLSGKIRFSEDNKARIVSMPIKIYLVPADKEKQNNVLFYAETNSDSDGAYSFSNIAEGEYFLYAEPFENNSNEIKSLKTPNFWKKKERLELYKKAEAAKNNFVIKSCENLVDKDLNV